MDRLQDAIDLVLPVPATRLEPARDVHEERVPAIAPGGDRLEASLPEERSELGRSVERGPPHVVAFRSLHPCDDTAPCRLERRSESRSSRSRRATVFRPRTAFSRPI